MTTAMPQGAGAALVRDRSHAWAQVTLVLAVLLAYGAVWTRGIQGDDVCMCELATSRGYWDAVRFWLQTWNGRFFLAATQLGTYALPWFARPLDAPWFILHALVLLGHTVTCVLLLKLLWRAGVAVAPSLAAVLVLAIHPITFESVLWLAAGYGYVFGTLLAILAVWTYLEYERSGHRVWLVLTVAFALAATTGIEQYFPVLGTLAILHLVRARWRPHRRPAWVPLAIVVGCAAAFLLIHFGLFPSSRGRIERATSIHETAAGASLPWRLAWWLSLLPDASPWGGLMRSGIDVVKRLVWLAPLIVAAAIAAGWRVGASADWERPPSTTAQRAHLWLVVAALAVAAAAVLPFAFTGGYGVGRRNAYVMLPGLLVAGAAALDVLYKRTRPAWRKAARYLLAPMVAAVVAASIVTGIGAQAMLAQSWAFHRGLIGAIELHADAIRSTGGLELTVASQRPYGAISQMHPWVFPCLVRWATGDSGVRSWISVTPPDKRSHTPPGSHRIELETP
jgi:hypothetical protein